MTFGAPESDDYSGRHVDVFVDGERLQAGIVIEDADRAGGAKCATHEDAPLGAAPGRRWDRLEDAMREVAEALGPTPHGPTAVARRPVVLPIPAGHALPKAALINGVAHFGNGTGTEGTRGEAWASHDENSCESADARLPRLEELARRKPTDLAVVMIYGRTLELAGRERDAIDVYRHCVALGTAALPDGFAGRIALDGDESNGLIEAAGGLGRCECTHGSRVRGIEILEEALRWHPDDGSEAALRLGSEYTARGDTRNARRFVEARPGRKLYPPYDYDLALCDVIDQRWESGVAAAIRGLAGNPYIGEMLLGADSPREIPMGNPGEGRGIEMAEDYVRHYRERWDRTDGALHFLRWVQTHPVGMAAVAAARRADHAGAYQDCCETRTLLHEGFVAALGGMRRAAHELLAPYAKRGIRRPWDITRDRDAVRRT